MSVSQTKVFISHSGPDLPIARELVELLEERGIPSWLDSHTLPLGEGFVRQIGRAIRSCRIFVLLDSANARRSYWVSRELSAARRLRDARVGVKLLRLGPQVENNQSGFDFSCDTLCDITQRCSDISATTLSVLNTESDSHRVTRQTGSGVDEVKMWIGLSDHLAFLDTWWFGSQPGVCISGPPACGKTGLAWTWITSLEEIGFDRPESVDVSMYNQFLQDEELGVRTFLQSVHTLADRPGGRQLIIIDSNDEGTYEPIAKFVKETRASNIKIMLVGGPSCSSFLGSEQFQHHNYRI